jgi:hypothetical protein
MNIDVSAIKERARAFLNSPVDSPKYPSGTTVAGVGLDNLGRYLAIKTGGVWGEEDYGPQLPEPPEDLIEEGGRRYVRVLPRVLKRGQETYALIDDEPSVTPSVTPVTGPDTILTRDQTRVCNVSVTPSVTPDTGPDTLVTDPLACPYCDYVGTSSGSLRTHRSRKHPEAPKGAFGAASSLLPVEVRDAPRARVPKARKQARKGPSEISYAMIAHLENLERSRSIPIELPPKRGDYCRQLPGEPYMGKCRTPSPFD